MPILALICALYLISVGMICLIRRLSCTFLLDAVFVRFDSVPSRGYTAYSPVFRVTLDGNSMECRGMDTMSRKKAEAFIPGESYPVYIDPKDPRRICITRTPDWTEYLMICLGSLLLAILTGNHI